MKEEALTLADELANEKSEKWITRQEASAMIRRLVEELDTTEKAYKWTEMARNAPTKPLSDEEIYELYASPVTSDKEMVEFARAIEERHGIK